MKKILIMLALVAYGIPATAADYVQNPSMILDRGTILGFTQDNKGRQNFTVSVKGTIYYCIVASDAFACTLPDARTK